MAVKSPSFQFYPADWMTGSPAKMRPEETHVYLWLLCIDWDQGGFVYNEKDLAYLCRLTRNRFKKAWEIVKVNFVERDGRLYNPRLERERAKQEEWRRKSSEGGRLGASHRWENHNGGHKGGHATPTRVVTPPYTPNDNSSVFSFQSSDPVSSASSAREALTGRELLLSHLTASRRTGMVAALDVWAQGVDLPAGCGVPTEAQLDRACREVLASVDAGLITVNVLRGFLVDIVKPKPTGPPSTRSGKPQSFAEMAAARKPA